MKITLFAWPLLAVLPGPVLHAAVTAETFAAFEQRLESEALKSRRSNPTRFADYSPAGFAAMLDQQRRRLAELRAIDRAALSPAQQVTYDVIEWDAERLLDRAPYPWLQFPYTPYEYTFNGPHAVLTSFRFASDADVDDYLALAARFAASADSMTAFVRAQRAAGIYVQRDVAVRVRSQITDFATAPEQSFAWPSDLRLAAVSSKARERLRRALAPVIERHINPSLERLAGEFDDAYAQAAPRRFGLAQYPGGREYYKVLVKYRLTLDISPEDLLRRSQEALDRVESDLQTLRAEMGEFGPRRAFDARLAADPRFTAKTPADVERTYLEYQARMDPFMPRLFCRPAPYGYGVQRATPAQEAALTYGLAGTQTEPERRGMYYYNGSNLDQRSLLPAQALIYHELAPGHYWQAAMATVSRAITAYPRRNNAFAEAWGDFAQLLAYEQGVFRTPQEKYGRRLFNAMFHARALADVGVNYFGYDFDWGLEVLRRYTFESELQNRSSLVRDTTDWQAQILPYSFGSDALLRLREQTRAALGERFSEPRFYDAVLSLGSVPFPVLERHLDGFIAAEKAGAAPGICDAGPAGDNPPED